MNVCVNWYLVHSKPQQENIAASSLQRLGVETFCPRLKKLKADRPEKRTIISPLFPGYLFSRFVFATDYRKVNYAHGVRDVVMFGSIPAMVDDVIIESLKDRVQDGIFSFPQGSFQAGQVVRIEGGPFSGLQAVFEKELSASQRVVLLLRTVAFQARIVIDRESVVNG